MSTENIVKNKYYRILKDKTNAIWDRISFWTHADDVELTNGTTLSYDLSDKDAKITGTQSDFAQVETSPTTHAYVKGQMLIYNNQTYRVIAAIAVGNTLTVGTNIEPISVSTLSSMLTASDGKQFYLDVKDGSYGFYPSASKTPSEFVPFGGTELKQLSISSSSASGNTMYYTYNNANIGSNYLLLCWIGTGQIVPSNPVCTSGGILIQSISYGTAHAWFGTATSTTITWSWNRQTSSFGEGKILYGT